MTLLNFKKDFVPLILDRSKPHTIRRERKHPIKVGDTLQLYYGLRTKSCILIGTVPCIRIQEVDIYPGNKVLLNEAWLIDEQIWELARRDGFSETAEFFNFFKAAYALPTSNMRLIWWDVNQLKINRAIYDVFSEVYDAK